MSFPVLEGEGRSPVADPDLTRPKLARLPNGTIRTLDARHWIPTEQPEAMRSSIETWCKTL